MKLINIGFGNMVSAGRVVAVVSPDSAPVKRLVKEARERGMLIDASYGRSTRAVPSPRCPCRYRPRRRPQTNIYRSPWVCSSSAGVLPSCPAARLATVSG